MAQSQVRKGQLLYGRLNLAKELIFVVIDLDEVGCVLHCAHEAEVDLLAVILDGVQAASICLDHMCWLAKLTTICFQFVDLNIAIHDPTLNK